MRDDAICFSDSLQEARQRFLAASDRIGLQPLSLEGSIRDENSVPFVCDAVRLGSPDASMVTVLCGSASGQAGLLSCAFALGVLTRGGLKDLPRDVALVLVHAANPHGPVWPYFTREETGEGQLPEWSDNVLAAAERRFRDFQTENGVDWTELAGATLTSLAPPAWSGAAVRAIRDRFLVDAEKVCLIDPRTGPGQLGGHEVVPCDPEGAAGRARAERWFTVDVSNTNSQAIGEGPAPCAGGLGAILSGSMVTNIIVEFGTYSMAGFLGEGRNGRAPYPKDAAWRAQSWKTMRSILKQAYRGLIHDL